MRMETRVGVNYQLQMNDQDKQVNLSALTNTRPPYMLRSYLCPVPDQTCVRVHTCVLFQTRLAFVFILVSCSGPDLRSYLWQVLAQTGDVLQTCSLQRPVCNHNRRTQPCPSTTQAQVPYTAMHNPQQHNPIQTRHCTQILVRTAHNILHSVLGVQ